MNPERYTERVQSLMQAAQMLTLRHRHQRIQGEHL